MVENQSDIGRNIYDLAARLFPICRSITGNGVRETMCILDEMLLGLKVYEVPTGTKCFDWNIPDEWNITDAYILDPDGKKVVDFKENNLHILSYSEPADMTLSLEELKKHLYSDPSRPDAIPYRTSYYERRWGFCLSHSKLEALQEGEYRVFIDSTLEPGSLTYGELLIPGQSKKEIFLSTYVCHPSMGNNEVSGISVTAFIAKWLLSLPTLRYTYRIIFVPETIGAICYLSRNLKLMQKNIKAGFNVTCVGDDNSYSYLKSRNGNTLADRVAEHVIKNITDQYVVYPYLICCSDERQYCSPGVDLPLVSIMRTKYGQYPEYHSSLDNMDFISPAGLAGGYNFLQKSIDCLEHNERLRLTTLCQPQLGKRGLYPNLSSGLLDFYQRKMVELMMMADGRDLLDIADCLEVKVWDLYKMVERLKKEGLLKAEKL